MLYVYCICVLLYDIILYQIVSYYIILLGRRACPEAQQVPGLRRLDGRDAVQPL